MSINYPSRPKVAKWFRFLCMAFGLANIISGIASTIFYKLDVFILLAAFLVGGAWFMFGKYGGFPLVDTVREWHPVSDSDEVNEMHRRGLLVMRRRKWLMWASIPSAFVVAGFLIPVLMRISEPGLIVLLLSVPLIIISFSYFLSRCPRCGYGFFTRSTSRGAMLSLRATCGHCGLSVDAYKAHNA